MVRLAEPVQSRALGRARVHDQVLVVHQVRAPRRSAAPGGRSGRGTRRSRRGAPAPRPRPPVACGGRRTRRGSRRRRGPACAAPPPRCPPPPPPGGRRTSPDRGWTAPSRRRPRASGPPTPRSAPPRRGRAASMRPSQTKVSSGRGSSVTGRAGPLSIEARARAPPGFPAGLGSIRATSITRSTTSPTASIAYTATFPRMGRSHFHRTTRSAFQSRTRISVMIFLTPPSLVRRTRVR